LHAEGPPRPSDARSDRGPHAAECGHPLKSNAPALRMAVQGAGGDAKVPRDAPTGAALELSGCVFDDLPWSWQGAARPRRLEGRGNVLRLETVVPPGDAAAPLYGAEQAEHGAPRNSGKGGGAGLDLTGGYGVPEWGKRRVRWVPIDVASGLPDARASAGTSNDAGAGALGVLPPELWVPPSTENVHSVMAGEELEGGDLAEREIACARSWLSGGGADAADRLLAWQPPREDNWERFGLAGRVSRAEAGLPELPGDEDSSDSALAAAADEIFRTTVGGEPLRAAVEALAGELADAREAVGVCREMMGGLSDGGDGETSGLQ
jgi:hypothetical protein